MIMIDVGEIVAFGTYTYSSLTLTSFDRVPFDNLCKLEKYKWNVYADEAMPIALYVWPVLLLSTFDLMERKNMMNKYVKCIESVPLIQFVVETG